MFLPTKSRTATPSSQSRMPREQSCGRGICGSITMTCWTLFHAPISRARSTRSPSRRSVLLMKHGNKPPTTSLVRFVRSVEQLVGKNGVKQSAIISIIQNPGGNEKKFHSTLYQGSRKDAMPGTDNIADGSFIKNGGNHMSFRNGIQHPGTLYNTGSSWEDDPPTGFSYSNLWSIDNTENFVIKTIYDPCPAGFKLPAVDAFSGFILAPPEKFSTQTRSEFNVSGDWDMGWHFNNKITSPDNTVYFPILPLRRSDDGSLTNNLLNIGESGSFWMGPSANKSANYCLDFYQNSIQRYWIVSCAFGLAVRPVAE